MSGNMAHCRFVNTRQDLQDCLEHIEDDLSEAEKEERAKLALLCAEFHEAFMDMREEDA